MKQFALIWDMDGTLVDSYPAIVPAARETLADFGLDLSEEEIRREVLNTSVGALLQRVAREQGWDPAPIQAAFQRRNDSRIEAILPMPHARDCLAALERAGCRSFVYTHRGTSCPAILEHTGLRPYFTELVTALNGLPRKPAPEGILYLLEKYALDPAACFYVGDRRLDMEAAENAGIGGIFYAPPENPVSPTGRERFVVRDLLEIPALLKGVG